MTPESDTQKIKARLMKRVGARVIFTYPGAEGVVLKGLLKDRAVVASGARGGVQYYDVVDLIAFDSEPESLHIRITYYRHLPNDRLVFAGQTSICEPVSVWTRLLAEAREKDWFPVGPKTA
jgi:hypothetical protein